MNLSFKKIIIYYKRKMQLQSTTFAKKQKLILPDKNIFLISVYCTWFHLFLNIQNLNYSQIYLKIKKFFYLMPFIFNYNLKAVGLKS